jgi:hypothetical protein
MKIIGYALVLQPPYIPLFVLTPNGMYDQQGRPADGESVQISAFEIAENEWIGVSHDRQIQIFKRSEEDVWRSKAAQETVSKIGDPRTDPEGSLRKLRAAADLIGVDLPSLLSDLESKKVTGESIVDAWIRTKST